MSLPARMAIVVATAYAPEGNPAREPIAAEAPTRFMEVVEWSRAVDEPYWVVYSMITGSLGLVMAGDLERAATLAVARCSWPRSRSARCRWRGLASQPQPRSSLRTPKAQSSCSTKRCAARGVSRAASCWAWACRCRRRCGAGSAARSTRSRCCSSSSITGIGWATPPVVAHGARVGDVPQPAGRRRHRRPLARVRRRRRAGHATATCRSGPPGRDPGRAPSATR